MLHGFGRRRPGADLLHHVPRHRGGQRRRGAASRARSRRAPNARRLQQVRDDGGIQKPGRVCGRARGEHLSFREGATADRIRWRTYDQSGRLPGLWGSVRRRAPSLRASEATSPVSSPRSLRSRRRSIRSARSISKTRPISPGSSADRRAGADSSGQPADQTRIRFIDLPAPSGLSEASAARCVSAIE